MLFSEAFSRMAASCAWCCYFWHGCFGGAAAGRPPSVTVSVRPPPPPHSHPDGSAQEELSAFRSRSTNRIPVRVPTHTPRAASGRRGQLISHDEPASRPAFRRRMAPASSSSAGVACLVLLLLLLLAGASAAHGSFQARRALSGAPLCAHA